MGRGTGEMHGDREMRSDRPSGIDVDGSGRVTLGGRRWTVKSLLVGVVVVFAALLVVEQVGAAPSTGGRAKSAWSAFQPAVKPATHSNSSTGGSSSAGSQPTGDAAVAAAQQQADAAVAHVQNALAGRPTGASGTSGGGSGTAAANPAVGPRVCPILLEEGAELIQQTNRLIAANPSLAPKLIAVRDRGLARINQLLARFGCPISFG